MPKGRILAVDDQRYFRELLEGMLVEEGFEVQTASDGLEALRILERATFDIVLTDLVMPEMDGNELVHRVKQYDPDQDIVVVTGVVDVKTAVDSMKLGASEYLLKPFDRDTLANTLEGVLHRKRLRVEHARLLAENIEYMGERTLIERAMALFSFLSVEPLSERIVDGLCVETGAQGGLLWIAEEAGADRLRLVSARGLVRVDEEPESLDVAELPEVFRDGTARSLELDAHGGVIDEGTALLLVLRDEARVSGVVRLTDKLGGERFDSIDRSYAEKFVGFAQSALVNAIRYSALERRTLEDAETGAYTVEYFENAVRNEIEKSTRHGRGFSVLKVAFTPLAAMRSACGERAYQDFVSEIVQNFSAHQRSTDLLAFDGEGEFLALLPEADAMGAALLKGRAAGRMKSVLDAALDASPRMASLAPHLRPQLNLAVATFPSDGTQLDSLMRMLDERIEQDRKSLVRELELDKRPLAECFALLLERGFGEQHEAIEKIGELVLRDPTRSVGGRSLLYAAPGRRFAQAVSQGLRSASDFDDVEIAVMSEQERPADLDERISWVSDRGPRNAPFVMRFGEGPAYALICDDSEPGQGFAGKGRMFHTADRGLIEHLALRVQEDLAG